MIGPTGSDVPRLSVATLRGPDGTRSVRVDATLGGLAIGSPIAVTLTGLGEGNPVLASAVQRAGGDATDTVRLAAVVPDVPAVQVDVSLTGRLCQAVIPITSAVRAESVSVTCRAV